MNSNNREHKYTNRLIEAASPYLLQHAHNPVDWYPWGEEAIKRAKAENKPIFLSIGYAACHWCHVMERESFEDPATAALLNEHYIAIKVDREERPDLDQIYMAATQALSGGGGWPMSVFLTPDLKPFFAGTYFHPVDMQGRPGFKTVLTELIKVYSQDRDRIDRLAGEVASRLKEYYGNKTSTVKLDRSIIDAAAQSLIGNFDKVNGGFGGAPKFPHASDISFLFKYARQNDNGDALYAALYSLRQMGRGGIYDQIGGGFHRYSVDARWLVPHFEKMLYDNAMLALVYAEAFQITKDEFFRRIVRGTLDFVLREMTDTSGGFYSSLDADSEGEEGRYYVWSKSDIDEILGEHAEKFCKYYNITERGNFEEHSNIPNVSDASDLYLKALDIPKEEFFAALAESRRKLFEVRAARVRPFTDDKVIVSWSGLMISGFACGYQVTGDKRYLDAAAKAADFIIEQMYSDGELKHSWRGEKNTGGPFLEDYACFIKGLIDLYEVEHNYSRIRLAAELADKALVLFADDSGNLFLTPADKGDHFMRPKEITDGALPAPGSILMQTLIKLSELTGDRKYEQRAEQFLSAISADIAGMPQGYVSAVQAFEYLTGDRLEIVLAGNENRDKFTNILYLSYLPNRVIVVSEIGGEGIPLLAGRQTDGPATAYICRNSACQLPATTPQEFEKQLSDL